MPDHSPTPWEVVELQPSAVGSMIRTKNGAAIAVGTVEDADNCRRIVACVNALEGIPTEIVEKIRDGPLLINDSRLKSTIIQLVSEFWLKSRPQYVATRDCDGNWHEGTGD